MRKDLHGSAPNKCPMALLTIVINDLEQDVDVHQDANAL
jgi:hypothetical protein